MCGKVVSRAPDALARRATGTQHSSNRRLRICYSGWINGILSGKPEFAADAEFAPEQRQNPVQMHEQVLEVFAGDIELNAQGLGNWLEALDGG